VTDPIPPEAASWILVDAGGGTDASTPNELCVLGISVLADGGTADIVLDLVIDNVPDGTIMSNTATWTIPTLDSGTVEAPDVVITLDADGDGIADPVDNCPSTPNANQADGDNDGVGDACDGCPADPLNDVDNDGLCADADNCPSTPNANQADGDNDGIGDVCDGCPTDPLNDMDNDGFCADVDNCPVIDNPGQEDTDGDGIGDACAPGVAKPVGCICTTTTPAPGGAPWGPLLLFGGLLCWLRRRARRAPPDSLRGRRMPRFTPETTPMPNQKL
jgi:hypothetical protein